MSEVGQRERLTQRRVVQLLRRKLGYEYLGDWQDRAGNANVEEELLRAWLTRRGHDEAKIARVLHELASAAAVHGHRSLYDTNRDMYDLLRYGVKIKPEVGAQTETVWLINWKDPAANDFAIAEEVTVAGEHDKRPDIVLYVNGVAVGVLELKRSVVAVAEGIRQNLGNQTRTFIRPFFATVQLVMAGNDTEGLRYGVIETPERYSMTWKESSDVENPLDRALIQLCRKERLLELIHDFVAYELGTKKICRTHQYLAVRAAGEHVRRREGGIIWHTQGAGKTLTMVWLARWIRENVTGSRVLLVTDRTDLDEQLEGVFQGVNEEIRRTRSGADLLSVLARDEDWLVCSLVQKFGTAEEGDVGAYVRDIEEHAAGFRPKGEIFVFVDECHRSHSALLHNAMKRLLPGAMFIGFTGTPLLKKDKRTSIETFGTYIHTYRYDEAVRDDAVVDLVYEARDIDQRVSSPDKVDEWFERKTRGMNDIARAQLKQRWGTMQQLLSAQDRLAKIVSDIVWDMETKDRLASGRGNALLVAGSIHEACRLFEMFQKTDLAGKCAIVTSYRPLASDIKTEEAGEGKTERLERYDIYRGMLAAHFDQPEDVAVNRVEEFERQVKERFVKQPGQMKLLIVVDKLLTGFDAPPATYLYIDKPMHDHGLFQAVCRVNRIDTADKEYGYIVDYRDLFKALEQSVRDYTGEALSGYDASDVRGLLKDRLTRARERLEEMLESVKTMCDPVEPPRDTQAYLRFFCGTDRADADQLRDAEPRRIELYRQVSALVRAYSAVASEMEELGYAAERAAQIKSEVEHYEKVRAEVKLASGDYVDLKMYEPAMRHLLDTYVRAEDSVKLSAFEDKSLLQLIVERDVAALEALPDDIRHDHEATAEVIENNVRKVIVDEMAVNPVFYGKMSELLDALIKARKEAALEYKDYLAKIVDLAKKVREPERYSEYPTTLTTRARRALYDNLNESEELAIAVDAAIRDVKKDGWRGNSVKEKEVKYAIRRALGPQNDLTDAIFQLAKEQREY